jgi:D-alanine-D-alanine ligase
MVSKLRVGVMYGSRSVEHEVSIITALQVMNGLNSERYEVVPLYLTKEGEWLTGEDLRKLTIYQGSAETRRALTRASLPPGPNGGVLQVAEKARILSFGGAPKLAIDVAFPCFHGTFGEDGTVQGLLELADLPYVGSGVVASAVGMDKIMMKAIFRSAGLPVLDCQLVLRDEWKSRPTAVVERLERAIGYPAFVKPANLGSSVGISKATDSASLKNALDVAASYDRRVLVEPSIEGAIDINCSVLGWEDDLQASVCEQPISWETFLSYDDKYIRGGKSKGMKGQSRRIPAPIGDAATQEIQRLAKLAFRAIDAAGVARIDFLIGPDEKIYVNEINTLPGSLAFYLWEATDLPFPRLLDRLIELALTRHRTRADISYSFDSALLRTTLEGSGKARPG